MDKGEIISGVSIKILQHFDITETWSFEGNAGQSSASKFGNACAEFQDSTGKAVCTNTTGIYNLKADGEYEAECFVKADLSVLKAEADAIEQEFSGDGYKFYGGHTFRYIPIKATWKNAKAVCEALGGHLATSTSAEKNAFLLSIVSAASWLGGTDEETEGVWKWVTGEAWSYTNWNKAQPDNAFAEGEHYLQLYYPAGNWNDARAVVALGYICEWDYDMREQAASTGNPYKFYDGHTFQYIKATAKWSVAKTACEALGGHLATSTSAGKNEFLLSIIGATSWLGGTDEETEGVWKWITGETWSYANWNSGEPNNSGNNEPYLELRYPAGVWNDESPSATRRYVCEWDYDMREKAARSGNLMRCGDELTLGIMSDGRITLQSSAWNLDKTSELAISSATLNHHAIDTWHHILLRISGGEASVYIGGELAASGTISGSDIKPEKLKLGGYKGYLDEFVFRDSAGSGTPKVPVKAYGLGALSDHEELNNLLGGNDEGHYHLTRKQAEWIEERMNEELRPKIKPGQTIKIILGEELSGFQVESRNTGSENTISGGKSDGD